MQRILYIDSIPERITGVIPIERREDIIRIIDQYFMLEIPKEIILDCRSLESMHFSTLLKFIEEYKGDIILIATEPVLSTIISRFIIIHKEFIPKTKEGMLRSSLEKIGGKLRDRILNLFDVRETDDDRDNFRS